MLFKWFFGNEVNVDVKDKDKDIVDDIIEFPKESKKKIIQKYYLIINKQSQTPLGIFDNLENAKHEGRINTYYNCSIMEFVLNDGCKYLNNPIYEDD